MFDPREPVVGESPSALAHLRPLRPWPPLPSQADALSDPVPEEIAQHLADLMPRGAAWRTPDGASFDWASLMGAFLKALAADLAVIYRRIFAISQDSTASTLVDSLADWEAEFGLPDSCMGVDPSREARVRSLLARVRSTGTITPADFIALAAELGFSITIDEPLPWRCGASACGSVSERVAGGIPVEFIWIVKPGETEIIPFRAGAARAGTTRLGEIRHLEALECLFDRLKPAWTRVVFNYAGA